MRSKEDNLKKFKETWAKEIENLRSKEISSTEAFKIKNQFEQTELDLRMTMPDLMFTFDINQEVELVKASLTTALAGAQSKYEQQRTALFVNLLRELAKIVSGFINAIIGIPSRIRNLF